MIGSDGAPATGDSPTYDPRGGTMYKSLATTAVLMFLTIGGMVAIAQTPLAPFVNLLFRIPIVGAVVIGIAITIGRYAGIDGVEKSNDAMAIAGAGILVFSYSLFGGGILTLFPPEIWYPALIATGVITSIITLVAGVYVYMSDKNLSHWSTYSGYLFLGGFGAIIVGSFIQPVVLVGFALVTLAFVADLVYEIWKTSNEDRSPYANGIALYVAFAGVFVHILQIVLRAMADQ